MLEHAGDLHAFVRECQEPRASRTACCCGMGGSSLGPEVIRRSFGDIEGAMRLHVLDSTDPAAVLDVERRVDLAKTLFIISSKSGGTIETLSHYRYFRQQVAAAVGDAEAGKHFVAVTDPGSPLVDLAQSQRVPPRVRERPGHRRPLLGAVVLRARARGAAWASAIEALLHRCQVAEQNCTSYDPGHAQLGPLAGDRDGGAGRRRAATSSTFIVSEPISIVRPVGRAAGRREHRQAGQGRPAGGRRADRRRRTPTATTACSPTCATPTSPTRSSTPRSRRWPTPASRR